MQLIFYICTSRLFCCNLTLLAQGWRSKEHFRSLKIRKKKEREKAKPVSGVTQLPEDVRSFLVKIYYPNDAQKLCGHGSL